MFLSFASSKLQYLFVTGQLSPYEINCHAVNTMDIKSLDTKNLQVHLTM